jgi:hypothetical protein
MIFIYQVALIGGECVRNFYKVGMQTYLVILD